jgi:glucose-6-phosphate isomerase
LARERGFRDVFENRPDIGGRYSALSYFGMVPAALAGTDWLALVAAASRSPSLCRRRPRRERRACTSAPCWPLPSERAATSSPW